MFGKHIVSAPKLNVAFCQECITVIGIAKKKNWISGNFSRLQFKKRDEGGRNGAQRQVGGVQTRQMAELSLLITN